MRMHADKKSANGPIALISPIIDRDADCHFWFCPPNYEIRKVSSIVHYLLFCRERLSCITNILYIMDSLYNRRSVSVTSYNGNYKEKVTEQRSLRLIAIEWCTSRLRTIVFNYRISFSKGRDPWGIRTWFFQETERKREIFFRRNGDQLFPLREAAEYAWNNRVSHAISRGKSFSFFSFSVSLSVCYFFFFSIFLSVPSAPFQNSLSLSLISVFSLYLSLSLAQLVSILRQRTVENLL